MQRYHCSLLSPLSLEISVPFLVYIFFMIMLQQYSHRESVFRFLRTAYMLYLAYCKEIRASQSLTVMVINILNNASFYELIPFFLYSIPIFVMSLEVGSLSILKHILRDDTFFHCCIQTLCCSINNGLF